MCGLRPCPPQYGASYGGRYRTGIHVEEYVEDRYEGWEERMTYQDAIQLLGAEDYGND